MSVQPDLVSAAAWDSFVSSHPQAHLLQTSVWGELKSSFGWEVERAALCEGGKVVAGAQVLFRRLPLGLRLAYVPKGPLVDWEDDALCRAVFASLHEVCRARRAFMLKVEPDLPDSPMHEALLLASGFSRTSHCIQPRRTILIDLSPSEDEILRRMKSKTRYNIRLAGRKGVRVSEGKRDDVAAFTRLMAITGRRDGFRVHRPEYYARAYELFASRGMARLFVATYQEQPLAGLMAFAFGERAWYLYGASGDRHRNRMPAYALQWAAICWAKALGCRYYDMWGIPDESEETLEANFAHRSDGLWGVYRFKRGFGGRQVRYIGAFDFVYNRPLYKLYRMAVRWRRVAAS